MRTRKDPAAQEERDRRSAEEFKQRETERNAGRDDSNRCPSVHYFGSNCCQLDRGHEGPHIAEYVNHDGTIWPGKYRIWSHDTTTPCCNQTHVSGEQYAAWLAAHPEIPRETVRCAR